MTIVLESWFARFVYPLIVLMGHLTTRGHHLLKTATHHLAKTCRSTGPVCDCGTLPTQVTVTIASMTDCCGCKLRLSSVPNGTYCVTLAGCTTSYSLGDVTITQYSDDGCTTELSSFTTSLTLILNFAYTGTDWFVSVESLAQSLFYNQGLIADGCPVGVSLSDENPACGCTGGGNTNSPVIANGGTVTITAGC
jgi:hypothetical protein